jgi:cold shock CspA family protein
LSSPTGDLHIGRVAAYDPGRGLGTLTGTDAGGGDPSRSTHSFHCTAIADGSRAIDPGTPVAYLIVAGLGGVLEARNVTPIGTPGDD